MAHGKPARRPVEQNRRRLTKQRAGFSCATL